MRLTSKNAKTLPEGLYRLDRGIYLRVTKTARFWILKVQQNGKRREFGLGGVNQPIETVRNTASKIRAMLLAGKDPVEEKQEALPKEDPLYADYSLVALNKADQLRKWAERTKKTYFRYNKTHLIPALGHKKLSEITLDDLINVLTPLWTNPSTAPNYLLVLGYVLNFAHADGYTQISKEEFSKAVQTRLPSIRALKKINPVKHYKALPAEELRDVVKQLVKSHRPPLKCILFGILTVGRVSEYSYVKWSDIDLEKGVLTIPPERRKDRKPEPFLVPLSKQAIELLSSIPKQSEYVFCTKFGTPLTNDVPRREYQKFLGKNITTHGSRSSFSDWCAKNNKNFLVSEKCLMHSVGNAVFMAYQRDDLFDQRRTLLQEWADYLYS